MRTIPEWCSSPPEPWPRSWTGRVNDRDFDVALHVVFDTPANQDIYQTAPMHLKFIEEEKANWAKVRVFDSMVEAS